MKKITAYFKGVGKEFSKVSWPKKDELMRLSGIVLVLTLIFAGLVGVFDLGVQETYNAYNSWTAPFRAANSGATMNESGSTVQDTRGAVTAEPSTINVDTSSSNNSGVTVTPIEK